MDFDFHSNIVDLLPDEFCYGFGTIFSQKFHPVFGVCIVWIEWKCVDKSY